MYYRFTNQKSPMSDYGHAMFCNDPIKNNHYGSKLYTFDGKNAIDITDLFAEIKDKLKADEEFLDGYFIDGWDDSIISDLVDCFNPKDIVNSAEAWDNSELLTWFWNNIAEPNDILAITTFDGAIVFDESLLKESENIYAD